MARNQQLWIQANQLFDKEMRQELEEERKERVSELYQELVDRGQSKKADKKAKQKIKRLNELAKKITPTGWVDAMARPVFLSEMEELAKRCSRTGLYHPKELRSMEKFILYRINRQRRWAAEKIKKLKSKR